MFEDIGELSLFQKIRLYIIGEQKIIANEDLYYIMNSPDLPAKFKDKAETLTKQTNSRLIAIFALTGSLILSTRRYFPPSTSTQALRRMLIDLFLFGCGLTIGTNFIFQTSYLHVIKIKKELIQSLDFSFLKHMKQMKDDQQISIRKQTRDIYIEDKQFEQWRSKVEKIIKGQQKVIL